LSLLLIWVSASAASVAFNCMSMQARVF
jgi:hypothetical protein